MKMRLAVLVTAFIAAATVVACDANWANCPDCSTESSTATTVVTGTADASADVQANNGATVIIINVDNDVNVDVDANNSVQVEDEDDVACNTCSPPTVDAGTPPPPKPVVDAGHPDCDCKKVCKEYKRWHSGHSKHTCKGHKWDKLVCVKTVVECTRRK